MLEIMTTQLRNSAVIRFLEGTVRVECDRRCDKAWGRSQRPRVHLSGQSDKIVYLADDELGIAPDNPKTCEGQDAKPSSPDEFPNKWCVRECERCAMVEAYGSDPLQLPRFDRPRRT